MLSCKEVVKILSSEERPSWRRRLEIRLHLKICHHCSKYAKQLEIMKQSLRKLFISRSADLDKKKLQEIEDQIIKKAKQRGL